MLYVPPAFSFDDLAGLQAHIESVGLAMLVTVGERGPLVSHAPLLLDRKSGGAGTLLGHLAKGNPQIASSKPDCEAVAVFPGPDAYVSPGWYASKAEHGRVVPTWNYTVVHARGRLTLFEDRDRLLGVVNRLTARHESRFASPWSTADAPEAFIAAQLKGIVGFELAIEHLEGKRKLSQNRNAGDQAGVIEGLEKSADGSDRAVAAAMRSLRTE